MIPPAHILESLNLFAAMVWTGGLVAVTVATIAARHTLEPEQQVRFFAALGRRYAVVSGAALVLFIVSGMILAGDPGRWTAAESTVAALTALAALLTVVGVLNARTVQMLRSQAIGRGTVELDPRLQGAQRRATALRALIAVVTLAAVVAATI